MTKNCPNGSKEVGGVCTPTKKSMKKMFNNSKNGAKKVPKIIGLVLVATLISIGGWSVWSGVVGLLNLTKFGDWAQIGIGLGILLLATFLGWKKIER